MVGRYSFFNVKFLDEKGKYLSYDERVLIQVRLKDGWSANKIVKEIGCAPNTIRNEIRRDTISLYRGNVNHQYQRIYINPIKNDVTPKS